MVKKSFLVFACCLLGVVAGTLSYKRYAGKGIVQGRVIIFDGASSAGKSSLLKQLMPILDSSYQYIAVDDFVSEVFLEQQKLKLPEKEFFARINQQSDLMYKKIKILVAGGKNVILDTVLSGLEGEKSVREQLNQLKNIPTFMVLVHCPLLVLIERIEKRNEKASRENKPEDERSIATALSQFGHIYRPRVNAAEVSLGMISRSDVEYACERAKKEFGNDLNRFESFKAWLLTQIGLKDKEQVILTTRLIYGYIVDTSKYMPQECAQKIKNNLMREGKTMIKDFLTKKRLKHEPPAAIAERGWRYHHLGIPYTEPRPGETHYEHLKIYVSGFETSPYGIEWMRFENDCQVPDVVRKVPHVAFEVDDLDEALKEKEILLEPGAPSGGVRAAMIMHDGAPIELIEFKK